MNLGDLARVVPGAETIGDLSGDIHGITHDSRSVKPGDLFVCLVGEASDGHRFQADALSRGAAALLVQKSDAASLTSAGHLNGVPRIVVDDTRRALPILAAELFGHPSRFIKLIGITGTNGKTTTMFMVASILRAAGQSVGTIGTLGAALGEESFSSDRTTPESDQLQSLLAMMRDKGADAVAMEASSHALAQRRTDSLDFDAAAFTNLTQDHLDYHQTMESYFGSKLRLFTDYPSSSEKSFAASVNVDDDYGSRLAAASKGTVLTYGIKRQADIRGESIVTGAGQLAFQAVTPVGSVGIWLMLAGAFQVYNALAAIGVGLGLGLDLDTIRRGLLSLKPVPGRFEPVETDRGFLVIVDYAHTPDGLENLITSARQLNPDRIVLVFGCGGNRDRTKRPIMGRMAATQTEVAIVTSDNPRREDPQAIIEEILTGMRDATAQVMVEPDRRAAISLAISQAREGDLVLIAGKGHEDYQIVGDEVLPFDDRQVAREILGMDPSPSSGRE